MEEEGEQREPGRRTCIGEALSVQGSMALRVVDRSQTNAVRPCRPQLGVAPPAALSARRFIGLHSSIDSRTFLVTCHQLPNT